MFELTVYIEWWYMLKMMKNLKYNSFHLFLIIQFFLKVHIYLSVKRGQKLLHCAYRSNGCYQNSN